MHRSLFGCIPCDKEHEYWGRIGFDQNHFFMNETTHTQEICIPRYLQHSLVRVELVELEGCEVVNRKSENIFLD